MLEKRTHVLRPEHKTIGITKFKRYFDGGAVIRIDHLAIPSPETVHEPVAVEGGNVRLVTGRNDHYFAFFWTTRQATSALSLGSRFSLVLYGSRSHFSS